MIGQNNYKKGESILHPNHSMKALS